MLTFVHPWIVILQLLEVEIICYISELLLELRIMWRLAHIFVVSGDAFSIESPQVETDSNAGFETHHLYDITFDNVNQRTHARHYGRKTKGQQLNMVQAFAAKERVPTGHISAEKPSVEDIRKIDLATLFLFRNGIT